MLLGNCVCHCDRTPPIIGKVRRKLYPTVIADYEGISTHTWTTGTNSHTCTFTANVGDVIIMAPIRWVVYGVTAASQRFDWFNRNSVFDGFLHLNENDGKPYNFYGNAIRGFITTQKTILPVSGDSHMTLTTPCQVTGLPLYQSAGVGEAVVATQAYRYRHRVNGSGVGVLSGPILYPYDYTDFEVTLAEGDTYEFDIWYKFTVKVAGTYTTTIPFATSSRGVSGDANLGGITYDAFFTAYASDGFDNTTHKYNLTMTGGDLLTLVSTTVYPERQTWRYQGNGPGSGGPYEYQVELYWGYEMASLLITQSSLACLCTYRPADDANYINTTTFPGLTGTQLWRQGCFNWSGTTTFTPLNRIATNRSTEGRRSGTFVATDPYAPTSISVAYAPL